MAGNIAEALRRIEENKRSRSKILDLSGLGLSELPEELWDCAWVEELGLGHHYCWNEVELEWKWDTYRDEEKNNRLSFLPTDITRLGQLSQLFLDSTNIVDISLLRGLTNLSNLDLSDTKVKDISSLSSLENLRDLNLGGTKVKDLSPLSGLTNLRDLNLSFTKVKNLTLIRGLTNLSYLVLGFTKVRDIGPLSGFVNLSNLDLSHTKVKDISPLSGLMKLDSLNLTFTKVRDVCHLSSLTNLRSLDLGDTKVSDLSPLSSLTNLSYLYLSSTPVSELSPLSELRNLKNLNLSLTKVRNISSLSNLANLSYLFLSDTPLPYFPFDLLWLPQLKILRLQNTHCLNLPPELTQESNALPDLRNYHTVLQKNAYTSYQAKLITVGNGRVGKTSVLKTLFQLGPFDPQEDSTHGIRLFNTTVPLPQKPAPASLRLWDFGGQELYHATHRIFMKSRALYLLLWDQHTEQNPGEESINHQGKTYLFRNFPLSYWLGNIRALSPDAKIIVVCNKADDGQEHFPEELHTLQTQYKVTAFHSVSAKTGYSISALYQRVQELLTQMPEMGMPMPLSWKQVQDQLAAIQDQSYIPIDTYRAICAKEELSEGSAYTLLRFLHHSGFVFWHDQYLGDQIVLDQKWALDAIYTLLDRNTWYKVYKNKGLLQRSALALCWGSYTPEQVQLFLEIMQSCELALKIEDKNQQEDPTYLIPEFLPDQPATAVAYAWEGASGPVYHFRFQHPFFHAALVQRFIVRSAKLAEGYDLLWHSGILLKVEDTLARIQAYPAEGRIDMLLRGGKPRKLIERLKNEIANIQEVKDQAGFLLSLSGQPNEWVRLKQVKRHLNKGKTHIASTTGKVLELDPFRDLIHTRHQEERDKPLNLKELADRESGAQFLEKPEAFSLMEFKAIVKTKLVDDIEATLQYLQEKIQPASEAFDLLILLKGRWKEFKNRGMAGIVSHDNTQLSENQIRYDLITFINGLQEVDVKG